MHMNLKKAWSLRTLCSSASTLNIMKKLFFLSLLSGYLKIAYRLWKQVAAGGLHADITFCQVKDLQ